jgi:oligoendopeptidase F
MEYTEFSKIIKTFKKSYEDFNELYKMGFDFTEGKFKLESYRDIFFHALIESYYTEEGVDAIYWFMLENEFGKKDWSKLKSYEADGTINEELDPWVAYGAKDHKGNKICYSIKSTWEYIKKFKK